MSKQDEFCTCFANSRWVCEAHPERLRACGGGAPADPCPVCNRVDQDTEPKLPEDLVVDKTRSIKDRD